MKTRLWLAAAGGLLLLPSIATAAEPVETALLGMIADLDATPEWSVRYGELSYDAASETATITDFVARTELPGTEIAIRTISVVGYSASPDGSFTVRSATADGGVLKSGFISAEINDVGIEDLSVPVMDGFAFYPNRPFASIVKVYGEAIKTSFARARVGSIVFVQTIEGVDNRISYANLRLDGFANGKIKTMRAGPMRLESPSPQGLVTTTIGSLEGFDADLAAIIRVYDPDTYEDGVGDMVWHDGIRRAAYNDILLELPGANVTIGGVTIADLKVRQPPLSFAYFLDVAISNPGMPDTTLERLSRRHLPGLLGSWSIGEIAFSDFVINAKDIDHLAFGGISFTDLSIDGLGEFAIEDFGVSVRGEGAMRVGRFAFGDIPFGGIDGLTRAIENTKSETDIDPTAFIPTPGFLELANVEIQTPDIDRLSLSRFRIDASKYIGFVPTAGILELVGLVLPTSAITDPQAKQMLQRFGYDQVDFSAFLETEWREAGEALAIKDLRFNLKDMGSLAMNFVLEGFPLAAFQDDKAMTAALPGLTLVDGALTFKDESMVGNGLDLLAEKMNAPPEAFRQQFADAIPFFLSMATINDPKLMALIQRSGLLSKLTPVVRDFVAAPGASITFTVKPPSPVSIPAISNAVENAPDTLVGLLGLTVSGEPGVMPEEPAPPPVEPPPAEKIGGAPDVGTEAVEKPTQQPAN